MSSTEIREIPLAELKASPTNPRKTFDEAKLKDLAESMKAGGQLQVALVRVWPKGGFKGFEVIAGERRLRAAKLAGLEVLRCEVKELDDRTVAEIQLVENVQRDDLAPMEEAEAYGRLVDELKFTADEIVARTGKSRGYIMGRLGLLTLSPAVRKAVAEEKLSLSWAMELRRVAKPQDQEELLKRCLKGEDFDGIETLRELRDHIDEDYLLQLKSVAFSKSDANLVEGRPACTVCPERTGAQADLFGADAKKDDCCLNAGCFASKIKAHSAKLKAKAKEEGRRVIEGKEAVAVLKGEEGMVPLDGTCYKLKGPSLPYRDVLKRFDPKRMVEVAVAIDENGRAHEVVKKDEALKMVPQEKLEDHAGSKGKPSKAEKAAKEKKATTNKGSRLAWAALWPQVIDKLMAKPFKGQHMRDCLGMAVDLHMDYKAGRGWRLRMEKGPTNNYNAHHEIGRLIRQAKNDEEALRLFWHVVLGDGLAFFDPSTLDRATAEVVKFAGFKWQSEQAKGVAAYKATKDGKGFTAAEETDMKKKGWVKHGTGWVLPGSSKPAKSYAQAMAQGTPSKAAAKPKPKKKKGGR